MVPFVVLLGNLLVLSLVGPHVLGANLVTQRLNGVWSKMELSLQVAPQTMLLVQLRLSPVILGMYALVETVM